MTDHAINWVETQQALTPDKPFFMYYATGAVHAPHHVPKEYADKYAGRFDAGWDVARDQTLARQKAIGVVPADTALAPRPDDIVAWDTLTETEKKVFRRQAEVFAGFLTHTDEQVGRLVASLDCNGRARQYLVLLHCRGQWHECRRHNGGPVQ